MAIAFGANALTAACLPNGFLPNRTCLTCVSNKSNQSTSSPRYRRASLQVRKPRKTAAKRKAADAAAASRPAAGGLCHPEFAYALQIMQVRRTVLAVYGRVSNMSTSAATLNGDWSAWGVASWGQRGPVPARSVQHLRLRVWSG